MSTLNFSNPNTPVITIPVNNFKTITGVSLTFTEINLIGGTPQLTPVGINNLGVNSIYLNYDIYSSSLNYNSQINSNSLQITINNSGILDYKISDNYSLIINLNNTISSFTIGKEYKVDIILFGTDSNNNNFNTNSNSSPTIYCLCENTEVLTPSGYKLIQELQINDLVTTSDGRSVQIKKIHKSIKYGKYYENYYPVIIPANSIAENYPEKDCRMSQYHAIKFNDNWILPFKNLGVFKKDKSEEVVNYYHIQLENYETDHLVINGGLVVETLGCDKQMDGIEWETRVSNSLIL